MGLKDFFTKKQTASPVAEVQTSSGRGIMNSFESFSPVSSANIRLYRELRNSVPIIDAAIEKLVRLVCAFEITCNDKAVEKEMINFFRSVPVNGTSRGIEAFVSTYFDELLTCGTAVGEIISF